MDRVQKVALWTWMTIRTVKTEILCPPQVHVDTEQFALELGKQIEVNRLPAAAVLCDVDWEDTDARQRRILIRYSGTSAMADLVQILVGVDQMGNFTYVEERVCLKPPKLPKKPVKKKPTLRSRLLWGDPSFYEQSAWRMVCNEQWSKWRDDVLRAAYLSGTDDVFGRFSLAISGTVRQVIKTLFEDRMAEVRDRAEEMRRQQEIEELMEHNRRSF
jgi:hypothetical protein